MGCLRSKQKCTRSFSLCIRFEVNRLYTYRKDWPAETPVAPEALAAAGLYYLGVGDCVRCAFCQGTLKQWEAGDDPSYEHKKFFPNCPFVLGNDVGNVTMPKKKPVLESFPVEFRQVCTDALG